MTPLAALGLFGAGLLAGGINSVAGGGGFIAFPALLFHGVPPVPANATQTVALWPGVVASSGAYRRELCSAGQLLAPMLAVSFAGGLFGALLLLRTPEARFMALVPWLLLAATLLFTFGPLVTRRLQAHPHRLTRGALVASLLAQFAAATYGGYFGAGLGIIMLALLASLGMENIHQMNAFKSVLGAAINGVAVVTFILSGAVVWPQALVMMAGAALGGYFGAWGAQKVEPGKVRSLVIVIGFALTAYFFARG